MLEQQLVAGTFEHALHVLIDTEFDLSPLQIRFNNDDAGAPAYDPAVLLKIVLPAYSRGIISRRAIERACRENVLFMALSGNTQPAYTTVASFIRLLADNESAKPHCVPGKLRHQCLRLPDKTLVRQVAIFPKAQASPLRFTEAMKQGIDSPQGRALYGGRIATVEPVFGNLR